jgi:HB1, ASXL, restriction endonuclease HTH domain
MSEQLKSALEENRAVIEAGLAETEKELALLRERERELEGLVVRAKAALGTEPEPHHSESERLTLHEAIALVLRENGNGWMTVRELAEQVNRRQLYRKRDGSTVEANQIHARTKNYAALFEKDGPRVRLRPEQAPASSRPERLGLLNIDKES